MPEDPFFPDAKVNAPGEVRDDSKYYNSSAYMFASQKWTIGFKEAHAAIEYIKERTEHPGQYSVWTRQCNNFALDVLMRASVATGKFIPATGPVRPSYTYQVISGHNIPAAEWLPTTCMKRMGIETRDQLVENIKETAADVGGRVNEAYQKMRDRFR